MKYCIILLLSLLVLTNCTYFVDCPDKTENDKLTIGELKMNTFIHILPANDFCQILNRNENIELCHYILNECSGLINDLQNINESEFIRASHVEQCYNSLTSQIDMEFIFNGLVKPCQLNQLSQSYMIKSDLDEDEDQDQDQDEDQDQNDGEYYYQNIKLNDFNTVQFTMENDIINFILKDYKQPNEDHVLGFVYQQFDSEVVLKFQQSGDGKKWENLEKEEDAQSKGLTQVYDLDDMLYAGKESADVYIQVTCESGCFDGFKQVIGQFQISEWSFDFNQEDGNVQFLQSYELKDESNVLLNVFDGEENIIYIKSFINTDIQKTKFIHAMYQNKEMEKYLNNLVTISVKNTQDKEPQSLEDWPSPFVAHPIQMLDGEDENQQFQQYSFFNNHVIDFDGEGANWFAITIYIQPVQAHENTSFSSLYVGICSAQQTDNHQFTTNLLKNQFSTTLEFDVEFDIEKPFSLEHQILGMTEFDQGFSMITFIPDYVKKVPQEISPVFSGIEVLDYTTVFAGQGTYFVTWIFQVKQDDDFSVKIENKIQSDHIVEINDEQLINTININEERFSYLLFQKYDKDVSTTYSQYTLYFSLDEEIDVDKIEINQYIGYNYLNVPVPLQLYADEQLVDLVQDEFGQIYLQIDLTDNERCESDEGCILYTNILYRDGEINFENAQIFLKTEIVDDKKHNLVNGNFRSFTLSEHFPKEIIQTTYTYQDDKTGLLINAQNLEDVDLKITGYLKADDKASVEISGNNSFTRKIVHFTPEQIKNSCPEECTVTIIAERANDEDTFDNQVSGTVQLLNYQENEDGEQQQQIFNFEEIYFEDNRIYGDYQITKSFALLKSQEESNLATNQFFFKISEKSKEQKLITAFLAHAENNLNISIFQKFEYEKMSQKQIQQQSLKSQGVYLLPQCDEDGEEFDEDILCLFEIVVIVRQTGELEKTENALYFTTGNVNQLTQIQDQQQVDEILGIEKALSQIIILNDQNEMLPRIKIVQSFPTDNDEEDNFDGEDEYIQIQSDILESEGKYSLFYIDHSAENQYEKINYIYNDMMQDSTQTIFIENTVKKQYFLFFSQSNPVLERYSVSFQEFEADQLKQNLDQEFKVNDSKESSYKFYYQVESANSKNLEIQYAITDEDNTGKLFYEYELYQKGSENIHYPFETKQQFNVEDKSIFVNLENQECGKECLILFNFFYTSETDESNFDIKFKLIENDSDVPNPDGEIVYDFDVGYHVQANIYNKNDILQYVTDINTQERDAEELVVAWQQVDQSVTLEITYKFNDNEFNAVDQYSHETTSSQIIITRQISDLKKSECADECKLTVQMKITDGYDGENTQILGYLQAMFEFKEDQKISRNGPVILNEVEPVFQSYVQYKNTNNAIYAKVFASSTPEEPRMFFAMYQADSDENYDNQQLHFQHTLKITQISPFSKNLNTKK
ncbi:hypothetical protein PPERSA_08930 [Pseudocohnilembus persalinus]|uniref:Transmembrane protein n=1 Tax=Pseudocohnilembus persalinus TaxID=266149 RepID=A0A0V0R3A0_PSEPJ|nr:hypothetical protein PPERSA_08930 [Pseudocohnilembus persalinus]|eukprot:KRX08826.1 hypothetical protein PPERSA_08930 [Pseudocohnilembus persalinus]